MFDFFSLRTNSLFFNEIFIIISFTSISINSFFRHKLFTINSRKKYQQIERFYFYFSIFKHNSLYFFRFFFWFFSALIFYILFGSFRFFLIFVSVENVDFIFRFYLFLNFRLFRKYFCVCFASLSNCVCRAYSKFAFTINY